ncbi:MAG: trimeric intracellular cation channel family protein [Lachnospiraceae bacterium]|nr:trimeric intracellular cation channel family protein [Candidatus Minthocola equi]
MVLLFEIIGVIAYAVSGAMLGIKKKMDIFGVIMLGLTTATGGGLIRDIIIGVNPPVVFQHPVYAIVAVIVSIIVFLPWVYKRIDVDGTIIMVLDAIGLGAFVVVGVKAGIPYDNAFMSAFLGVITGVGGGLLRDILAGDIPSIFVRHFYACAAIIGAIVCVALWHVGEIPAMIIGAVTVTVLRVLAATFKWNLPKHDD